MTANRATTNENLITLLGGTWLTLGLFIDGYAHANIIDTATEDFFTPWHGIFYSGFMFTAGWISWLMYRRRQPGPLRAWIPEGYGWAVVGLIVFAIGGVGDMIWHTIFGVEVGIDALLSPTHLLLLFGLIVLLAAPMRATIGTDGPVWIAVASMTSLVLLASFFTTFAHPLSNTWTFGLPARNDDIWAAWTVAGIIVSTLIMGASALYLLQRFDKLPFGFLTVMWAVPAVGEAYSLGSTPGAAIVGGVVGGLVADGLFAATSTRPLRQRAGLALSGGIVALWSAWTVAGYLWGPNGFELETEIWSGQIALSGLVMVALTMLAFPTSTDTLSESSTSTVREQHDSDSPDTSVTSGPPAAHSAGPAR